MSFYDQQGRQQAVDVSSLRGLRTALTVLLAVAAVASLLCVVAYAGRMQLIDDAFETGSLDRQAVDDANTFADGSETLWVLLLVATGSVFIVWQYRHAKNARILGAKGGVSSPGWAIGGWFIPVANLVLPLCNLYDTGRASDVQGQRAATAARRGPAIVVVWGVCWGLAFMIDRSIGAVAPDPDDMDYFDQLRDADRLAVASNVGFLVAAVLAIVMVRMLTTRQEAALQSRLALIGGQSQAYASWPAPPPYGQPYSGAPHTPQPSPSPATPPAGVQPDAGAPLSPFAPRPTPPPAPPPVPPSSTT